MRLIALLVALAAGCTPLRPLDGPEDAGARDAGRPLDATQDGAASMPDAPSDASASSDAPTVDAWTPPGTDAGAPDAWTPDGWAPDAFTFDAGGPVLPSEPGDIVLSELMIDPGRAFPLGDAEEWLEIHNPSSTRTFLLTGCELEGMSSTFTIGGMVVIPPRGYAVLAQGPKVGLDPDWVYPGAYALRDTTDRVAIRCAGRSIDEVFYDTRAFGVVEGRSIGVRPEVLAAAGPELANDRNESWCTAIDTTTYTMDLHGTPGAANHCGTP